LRRATSGRNSFSQDIDFALADDLFGLYPSRREAMRSLRTLADAHHLCHRQLGLEDAARGGACTAYRQKNCRGVCIGKEPPGCTASA
jgi:excinuclease UvrABC nuclease subunit